MFRRQIEGGRIDGGEGPGDDARGEVETGSDINKQPESRTKVDPGAIEAQTLRNLNVDSAEAEIAELEGAPVEIGIERFGDLDNLGRRGRGGFVLELDRVRESLVGGDEAIRAKSAWAGDVVGVAGGALFGEPTQEFYQILAEGVRISDRFEKAIQIFPCGVPGKLEILSSNEIGGDVPNLCHRLCRLVPGEKIVRQEPEHTAGYFDLFVLKRIDDVQQAALGTDNTVPKQQKRWNTQPTERLDLHNT